MPGVIIGLTVVAMGTSAPELAVSVSAGLAGSNEIAVSNVVGSNIFNLLMVLGICALLKPLPVDRSIQRRDYPISLFATFLLLFYSATHIIFGPRPDMNDTHAIAGDILRIDGVIMLVGFILYVMYTIRYAKNNKTHTGSIDNSVNTNDIEETHSDETLESVKAVNNIEETHSADDKPISLPKSILFILVGIAMIVVGGEGVVNSAKNLALMWGMSETLVGLTIVAIGTSLPELVTSIVASVKGENGMAIGNVVGSNIFNLFLILGTSSTIRPIPVTVASFEDIAMLLVVSIIAYIFVSTGKKITRVEGAIMVAMYVGYTAFAIIR